PTIDVLALLATPKRRRVGLPTRYVGFEIPNRFAIGYGLDHSQKYRNLDYVAGLEEGPGSYKGCHAERSATRQAGGDSWPGRCRVGVTPWYAENPAQAPVPHRSGKGGFETFLEE